MVKAKFEFTATRIAALTGALSLSFCFILAALVPSITSADALNPLTDRTLLLTSSSPGWAYTDGAGDPNFAPAGSGANGQKTGETFTFDTSTNSTDSGAGATNTPVVAFTFQYCTGAAGLCLSPGDDTTVNPDAGPGQPNFIDDATQSDLNIAGSWTQGTSPGDFQVYTGVYDSGTGVTTWTPTTTDWTMSTSNAEDAGAGTLTGANNLITLKSTDGGISPTATDPIKVQFFPSSSSYITNPGSGAFFVKINDYNSTEYQNWNDNEPNTPVEVDGTPDTYTCGDDTGLATDDCPADVIDGGVTVANVMNQSIEIQTKVLETMDFSVGTFDPDTENTAHGSCDAIQPSNPNEPDTNPAPDTLLLGNGAQEYSLSPTVAYGTSSLWRLSTNSANGATVYYTGNTLADTEGNEIAPMTDSATSNASQASLPGSEQFGLGLNYTTETDPNVPGATGSSLIVPYVGDLDSSFLADITAQYGDNPPTTETQNAAYWYSPTLSPLAPEPSYGSAVGAPDGAFNADQDQGGTGDGTPPQFAFNDTANTIPVAIASEDTTVVDCSTGQVNYVANIAPSTPADTYTTKINYLAAPEY